MKGKEDVIQLALTALLARGHLLIEDVPGVGKTTLAQALARSFQCSFQRIQFTSDMLPSDVIGVSVFNPAGAGIRIQARADLREYHRGRRNQPHHAENAILAAGSDERIADHGRQPHAPAAEAVSGARDAESDRAPRHYPLPESQLDRFLMRIRMGYPSRASEKEIIRNVRRAGRRPDRYR